MTNEQFDRAVTIQEIQRKKLKLSHRDTEVTGPEIAREIEALGQPQKPSA